MSSLNLSTRPVIAWNTGRGYTSHGQRIAAAQIPWGVAFVDVDRGIAGWVRNGTLSQSAVMAVYDSGRHILSPLPDEVPYDYQRDLKAQLSKLAENI